MSKESVQTDYQQYVGPYRLEKTLGKGQTGKPRGSVHAQPSVLDFLKSKQGNQHVRHALSRHGSTLPKPHHAQTVLNCNVRRCTSVGKVAIRTNEPEVRTKLQPRTLMEQIKLSFPFVY